MNTRLAVLGIGLTIAGAVDSFLKTPNQANLEAPLRDANLNSKKYIRISSEYWVYEGASGNAFASETRTTYTAY